MAAAPSALGDSRVFHNFASVDENTLTFQLKPTQVTYANTLRRAVLTSVESVAFRADMNDKGSTTDVVVTANTTPMTNEMLADRIGLLPIHVSDPSTWNPEEYIFRLEIENDTPDTKPVHASDIEVLRKGRPEDDPVPVPNTQFFHPDPISKDTCLIAVLKGRQSNQAPQKIHLTAKATVGTAREHVRFSTVSQCSYSYTLDIDEARQQKFFEDWLMSTKKVDPKSLEQDATRKEQLEREFQTMAVQRCFLVNEKQEPYSFDFVIESKGIQTVQKIVERALQNIEAKCTSYSNLDKGNLPDNVRIQAPNKRMKGFDFIFKQEDHTLGNLLQTWMNDNLLDSGEITFVGWKIDHPLRDEMILCVGVEDGQQTTARAMVAKAAAGCAQMFRAWREDWVRESSRTPGKRTRDSLRITAANAKLMKQAEDRLAEQTPAPPVATTAPRKSTFYSKKVAATAPKTAVKG